MIDVHKKFKENPILPGHTSLAKCTDLLDFNPASLKLFGLFRRNKPFFLEPGKEPEQWIETCPAVSFLLQQLGEINPRENHVLGKPRKKHVLQSVFFSFFSSFLASHRGDIEARMGKPRKNHILQSVFFRFFLLPCLPQG